MIALRVSKNGETLCTAGAEDMGVLGAHVAASGVLGTKAQKFREDQTVDFRLHIGGLTSRKDGNDEHLRWRPDIPLSVGDCIQIELLQTNEVDLPESKMEKDVKGQEENERQKFLYAKEVYFLLKDKFGSD